VDSVHTISVPKGVVVGKVLSCEKHPDADKLNVCQVDIGSQTKQIVCGAKNVAKEQMVAVATVGADLGDNFIIKDAKLRGVDSAGMICGSSEIGLPKLEDGIWVLDESIGELKLGKELSEYDLVNDEVIEIELTANRGDCLSIYGVARDLSSALDIPLKEIDLADSFGDTLCSLKCDSDDVALIYQEATEVKSDTLMSLRTGFVELYDNDERQRVLNYVTQATGVLLRAYSCEPKEIEVKKDDTLEAVFCDGKLISHVGIDQVKDDNPKKIIEASYIKPDVVSKSVMGKEIEKDELYYHSSRGSESDLAFGLNYLAKVTNSGKLKTSQTKQKEKFSHQVNITFSKIDNFIGQEMDKEVVVNILEKLRFVVDVDGDELTINVPTFRHDIVNEQDVIEEIVRVVGIDNIASKPFEFAEKLRFNKAYSEHQKRKHFRYLLAGAGFFEAVHYFFDNREKLQKYGFAVVDENLDVANPINNDLNTLRSTLLLHMLESSSKNLKHGRSRVALFEIGRVSDSKRDESQRVAFIFSGEEALASVSNSGEPKQIDFLTFASKVRSVIGEFELKVAEDKNLLANPYEYARVIKDGDDIGFIAKVHIDVQREYDLPTTYICEVDFDKLKYEKIIASPYSKFPALTRDLSLITPKEMKFSTIREFLNSTLPKEVKGFAPIDIYESKELGENRSVTVRFTIQSDEKTFQEQEITSIMDNILSSLKDSLGIGIR
jgi:phenylalanyl-tRNA synthetase beta chain